MNSGYFKYLSAVIVLAAVALLSACEDEDRASEVRTVAASSSQDSKPHAKTNSAALAFSENPGHQNVEREDDPHGFWRVTLEGSGSEGTNWVFGPFPTGGLITVDANSFLDTNGTYTAGGYVFTNCDDLGFYLISQEPVGMVWVTNCGTTAFP